MTHEYAQDTQGRSDRSRRTQKALLQGLAGNGFDDTAYMQALLDAVEAGDLSLADAGGRLVEARRTHLPGGTRGLGGRWGIRGGIDADRHAGKTALQVAAAERAGMGVRMQHQPMEPLPSTMFDYGQESAVTGGRVPWRHEIEAEEARQQQDGAAQQQPRRTAQKRRQPPDSRAALQGLQQATPGWGGTF